MSNKIYLTDWHFIRNRVAIVVTDVVVSGKDVENNDYYKRRALFSIGIKSQQLEDFKVKEIIYKREIKGL